MLDRFLGEQFLNLTPRLQELERGLDDAVEEEGEVDEENKSYYLQPLKSLPAKTQRNEPDEESTAGVNGRAGCSTHRPSD